jgi:hypothetical protein
MIEVTKQLDYAAKDGRMKVKRGKNFIWVELDVLEGAKLRAPSILSF